MKIICVVPVYNEQNRLLNLIKKIKKYKKKQKIDFIFFNNGSTDKSREILVKEKQKFIEKKRNMGIGYALIEGLKYSLKKKYDIVIYIAGNGKMLPNQIQRFLNILKNKKIDYVNGSRFLPGGNSSTNPFFRKISIKIISQIIEFFFKKKITDATCGFRGFKTKIFNKGKIKFFCKKELYTYGFEYYFYGKILVSNIASAEVPVDMNYPKKGSYSKIRPIIDWYPMIKFWFVALFDNKKIF